MIRSVLPMQLVSPATNPAPVSWSKKAIATAIFALLGFCTLWLLIGLFFAALAATLGHLARYETKSRSLRGHRLATFGLTLAYLEMLVFPLLLLSVALAIPTFEKWRSGADAKILTERRTHASQLYASCEAFARANRNRYPESWATLEGAYIPSEDFSTILRSPFPDGPQIAFELIPHDRPVLAAISDSVIVIQEIAPPSVPDIVVIYASGRISMLHNPDYERP